MYGTDSPLIVRKCACIVNRFLKFLTRYQVSCHQVDANNTGHGSVQFQVWQADGKKKFTEEIYFN